MSLLHYKCDRAGYLLLSGALLIWIIHVVEQGPTVYAVGADENCLELFSPISP